MAASLFEKSVSLMGDVQDFDKKTLTKACFNLGWVNFLLQEEKDAVFGYSEALKHVVKGFGPNSRIEAKILNNRGVALVEIASRASRRLDKSQS